MALCVGHHKHFRRPCNHVDADGAEHLPFGGCHIGIARADDLGDRLNGFSAIGKRGNGLCTANGVDLGDAGNARRRNYLRRL